MKNFLLFSLSFTLLLSMPSFGQQKEKNEKNENSNGNNDNGRVNLLLPHGNIGINTLTPSERLEVIGNVRISDALYVKEIDVIGLTATNISVREDVRVGRDLFINGNVGIGVAQPSERLDINGNLRVSSTIFSDGIETNLFTGNNGTFSQNLLVKEKFTVNGLTGLGVPAPVERLEVDGNVKATGNFTGNDLFVNKGVFNNDVAIHQNISVSGTSGFTGKVTGTDLFMENTVESDVLKANSATLSGPLSVGGNAEITGNGSISQNLAVGGTADFTGKVTTNDLTVLNKLDLKNGLTLGSKLGIGVATPEAALHVAGDAKFEGNITAVKLIVQELEVANMNTGSQQTPGQISFDDNLFVKGSLGIGTEKTEGYTLSVNGKIRASDDIKVYPAAEWADYVFEESYSLVSLAELAAYIEKNRHLPEMPSATEVKKEGIHLGEMDAKLLQKIEELTLYVIQLEQENLRNKAENKELRDKNAQLERDVQLIKQILGIK